MKELPLNATQDEILASLSSFKITMLNHLNRIVTHSDAKYLEPRDLKTLADTALNLEDSLKAGTSEGELVRTTQRLLEKYGDGSHRSSTSLPSYSSHSVVRHYEGKDIEHE